VARVLVQRLQRGKREARRVTMVIRKKLHIYAMVQSEGDDLYQGRPSGTGCAREPAAEAVWLLAHVAGIAKAKP
jgi:hypothetical protein